MKSTKKTKPRLNFSTESPELTAKLKACDPEIQCYISELKRIISELQRQNLKIEAQNVSLDSRVKLLEKEKAKGQWQHFNITHTVVPSRESPKK